MTMFKGFFQNSFLKIWLINNFYIMESFENDIKVNNILRALQIEFSSSVKSDEDLIKSVLIVSKALGIKLDSGVINKDSFDKSFSVIEDIIKTHPNSELISEALGEIIKGRRAQVGEVRTWNGKKKQKQSDGSWKTIERPSKAKKKEEGNEEEKSGSEKTVESARKLKEELEQLKKQDNENPSERTKAAIANKEEQLRRAAKSVMSQRADEHESGKKEKETKEEPKKQVKKLSPQEAYGKLPEGTYSQMRKELDMKAKPGNFKDIDGVDFEKLSDKVQEGLNMLTVVDLPKNYGSSDEGNNSFWSDLPVALQGATFIGRAGDDNYYMIDTQGYSYARYVQRLDDFGSNK